MVGLGFVSLAIGATIHFGASMKSDLGWMALGGFVLCCLALAALVQPRFMAAFQMGLHEFWKATRSIIDGR
jgi:hypothetical protein